MIKILSIAQLLCLIWLHKKHFSFQSAVFAPAAFPISVPETANDVSIAKISVRL